MGLDGKLLDNVEITCPRSNSMLFSTPWMSASSYSTGQGRIVGWNEWIARVTGQSRQSVLGQNLYELFPQSADDPLADRH